jgi:hypothetical protein
MGIPTAGVNVVSTLISEALAYKSLLNVVANEDEYVAVLKKVKREVNARSRSRDWVIAYLRKHMWGVSAEKIRKIIYGLVHGK